MINRNIVLGAAVVMAAGSAQAAVPTLDTPPLSAQFSTTYYTNVAGTSAALATARGIQRSDVLYAPALLANLVEPMGGISFFLAGQAGYLEVSENCERCVAARGPRKPVAAEKCAAVWRGRKAARELSGS